MKAIQKILILGEHTADFDVTFFNTNKSILEFER